MMLPSRVKRQTIPSVAKAFCVPLAWLASVVGLGVMGFGGCATSVAQTQAGASLPLAHQCAPIANSPPDGAMVAFTQKAHGLNRLRGRQIDHARQSIAIHMPTDPMTGIERHLLAFQDGDQIWHYVGQTIEYGQMPHAPAPLTEAQNAARARGEVVHQRVPSIDEAFPLFEGDMSREISGFISQYAADGCAIVGPIEAAPSQCPQDGIGYTIEWAGNGQVRRTFRPCFDNMPISQLASSLLAAAQ